MWGLVLALVFGIVIFPVWWILTSQTLNFCPRRGWARCWTWRVWFPTLVHLIYKVEALRPLNELPPIKGFSRGEVNYSSFFVLQYAWYIDMKIYEWEVPRSNPGNNFQIWCTLWRALLIWNNTMWSRRLDGEGLGEVFWSLYQLPCSQHNAVNTMHLKQCS